MTADALRRRMASLPELASLRRSAEALVEVGVVALALAVLAVGLVFPDLLAGDSSQDAVMALRMHLAGDWVNLVRNGADYLDKPHLLFWSAMVGYRAFGVHDWSYRLPSVLVTLLGAWATCRLGARLYGDAAGKLAGIMFLTAQSILLGCHDVRMDALLTGFTALGTWQLARYLETGHVRSVALGAAGLALAVSAKGMVGGAVAASCLLPFVWGRGLWRRLWCWKALVGLAAFALVLSPVLVAYYLQFDAHPEKVVAGRTGVSGVRFILLGQSLERFGGGKGTAAADDPFFFFHTLAWAFLPWSLLLFSAWLERARDLRRRGWAALREREQLTFIGPLAILVLLSFSRFKLPHYLNVLLPVLAILTAGFLERASHDAPRIARLRGVQTGVVVAVVAVAAVFNGWAFPIQRGWVLASALALAALLVLSFRVRGPLRRAWVPSAIAILALNFLLDTNFYPQLGLLQAGRQVAAQLRAMGADASRVFFVDQVFQPVQFYAGHLFPVVDVSRVQRERSEGKSVVLVVGENGLGLVRRAGLPYELALETDDCPVSKPMRLIVPGRRARSCRKAYVVKVPPS